MKKVITYGSFDLFHNGHYRLLERAKKLGDYLIVGVTTEQYDEYRGKMNVVDSLLTRIENIKNTGLADEIIIEDHPGQKIEDIQRLGIDVFAIGSDWTGKFEFLKDYCEVVYLERTKDISSTMLRNKNYSIIKLGIIGSGRIAGRFVQEAKFVSGVNVEGVYNPHIESAHKFCETYELNFYEANLERFLKKVDAVYIASPNITHYEYIKSALQQKKHVLCEKPITLSAQETEDVYHLAEEQGVILCEALKTAYAPGFVKVLSIAKTGQIGRIKDIEACFTKLVWSGRELDAGQCGGSVTELASYSLLPILKLYGTDYQKVRFETFLDENGVDRYTKIYMTYGNCIATAKVGLGVKSEGKLLISGTEGYLTVDAPWWKTQAFEVCRENPEENEKFYSKFLGDGLRYELSDFVSMINGHEAKLFKLLPKESIAISEIIEKFLRRENTEILSY